MRSELRFHPGKGSKWKIITSFKTKSKCWERGEMEPGSQVLQQWRKEDNCLGGRRPPPPREEPRRGGRGKEEPRGVGRSPAGLRQSACSVQVHRPRRSHRLLAPPASGLTRMVALWPSQVAPLSHTLSFQTQAKHPSSRTQCSHGQGQKQRSRQTRWLCFEFLPAQKWQTPRWRAHSSHSTSFWRIQESHCQVGRDCPHPGGEDVLGCGVLSRDGSGATVTPTNSLQPEIYGIPVFRFTFNWCLPWLGQ